MQARCPYCGSAFEASRPGVQPCPGCGQQIDVPAPVGAVPPLPGPAQRGPTWWERRSELGFFAAFFKTWRDSLFAPHVFWPAVDPKGNAVEALLYGWICQLLYSAPGAFVMYVSMKLQTGPLLKAMRRDMPAEQARLLEWFANHVGTVTLGVVLLALVLYPLSSVITSAVIHLFAMMTGAAKNGFNATFRTQNYSNGAVMLSWVPCVGFLAALYQLGILAFGLHKLQDTTLGRAIAAVLIPIGLAVFCGCGCFGLSLLLGASAGGMR